MKDKFYITTPIYYANAAPHIGHAYTTVAADALARFYKSQGANVFLLTGMDEHGAKIQKAAEKAGKSPQEFVDNISEGFENLWKDLSIKYDGFIRTTDNNHKEAVRKVLQILFEKGAIYKGEYEGLYCTGCEQFKSENELVDGKCPDHNIAPEMMKEECYLLKMTELQKELIEKIKSDEFQIAPERYKKEILSFLEGQKLEDVSISRKNILWGIPLPFDEEHTTYVWADAFLNYLTGLGWDGKLNDIPKQWPADVQLIGKDILRVHATIWPIMLLHLGLPLPKKLFVHGHILSGGKKMSKTLGNVIGIDEMIEKFGVDGTRYLLLSAGTFGEDVDVTMERMVEKYNNDLANGLGNLVSRVVKLVQNFQFSISPPKADQPWAGNFQTISNDQTLNTLNNIEIEKALEYIWNIVRDSNKFIEDNKPWESAKDESRKEEFEKVMQKLVDDLGLIAELLTPFMPQTSEKIKKALETKKLDEVLFQRIK
ncbi:MAG: methionyl-tRNA synthetase [Parcubacteria group bacterium Athens0714_25]|nr:MAG: methionyl-tRNA synthetase [Parcubacteria group bacterium Athens0714_25]